jgi:hypothetical protein
MDGRDILGSRRLQCFSERRYKFENLRSDWPSTFTEDDKTTSHSAENGENDDPSIDDYVPTLEESMLGDAVDGYNEMPRLEGWDDDTTITFEKMENVPVCLGCGWEKSMGL